MAVFKVSKSSPVHSSVHKNYFTVHRKFDEKWIYFQNKFIFYRILIWKDGFESS